MATRLNFLGGLPVPEIRVLPFRWPSVRGVRAIANFWVDSYSLARFLYSELGDLDLCAVPFSICDWLEGSLNEEITLK